MRRGGFQFAELLVALALAAGPALVALHLINSNTTGARFNQVHTTDRLVLFDLAELLCGSSVEGLRTIALSPDKSWLERLLEDRTSRLPLGVRGKYASQLAGIVKSLTVTLDEGVAGQPHLFRLSLSLSRRAGSGITVKRLFRPTGWTQRTH
jgi:hypothetical protein